MKNFSTFYRFLLFKEELFMIQSDFHLHTCFSGDSDSPVDSMINSAISKGLKTICFTDHQDFAYQPQGKDANLCFDLDVKQYFPTIQQYKEKYQGTIEILTGVEFGIKEGIGEQIYEMANNYPFDFIIGSSHEAGGLDPYYPSYFESFGEEQGLRIYFESILKNIEIFDGFQSYGHLDYAVRYLPSGHSFYKPEHYFDIFDEAMKKIISMGKGIECNTSGLKYGLGYTHPHIKILKRYLELGGEILTIGSDGHKPEHIAYGFDTLPELLKEAGFRYYTIFRNRKPEFIKL